MFGCKCFILRKHPRSSKFAFKVDTGFLLGYEANAHTYRVFNNSTGLVETTRDMTFEESNGSQGEQVVPLVVVEEDPSSAIKDKAIGDIRPHVADGEQGDTDKTTSPHVAIPRPNDQDNQDGQAQPHLDEDDAEGAQEQRGADEAQAPSVHLPRISQGIQRDHPVDNILGDI